MTSIFRFSPSRLAVAYIALSVLALALFAIPLWYAWSVNVSTFRAYVHGEDMQRLVDVFSKEGVKGLAAAIDSRIGTLPGDEVILLADASKARLAGNLPRWPTEVPDAPGAYGLVIDLGGGSSMRVVVSHARLPGGYHFLMGRESVRFQSLVELFWYGIAGAMAIVVVLGAIVGWMIRRALLAEVDEISRTASAIAEGDLTRRLARRGGSDELDTLAQTVNGMLEQLARQNAQLGGEVAVRRQAEQALHRAQEDLEGLVAQRTAQLARANESMEGEKRLLEMIAKGSPLPATLDALCRLVEETSGGVLCSIMLLDPNGGRMLHGAGPSLPESYVAAIDGWSLTAGPCGMAASLGEPVIASDIASDERWHEYKALASKYGLRACWSTPIISSDGKVLGTFAMLSREPGGPTPQHQSTIEQVTHIASIAIERTLAEEELQRQKAYLDELFDLAPDAIVLTDLSHPRIIRVNQEFTRMFGYTPDEAVGRRLRSLIVPHELDPADLTLNPDLIAGRTVEKEVVRQRKDGTRFHAHITAKRIRLRDDEDAAYLIYRDITARKLAEEELRRQKAHLDELFDLAPDAIVLTTLEPRTLRVNQEFTKMFGYTPDEVIGRRLRNFIAPGELSPEALTDVPALLAGQRVEREALRQRKDGTRFHAHITAARVPLQDEQGLAYLIYRDITERKEVEKSLRESERRFRQLFENSADALFVHDERGRFVDCNAAACRALAYAREELLELSVADIATRLISEEERREIKGETLWERAMQGEPGRIVGFEENELRRKDGTTFPVEVGVGAIDYEGRRLIYASVRETTERKRAEEELRSRQEMLDLAQKAARVVAFEWRIAPGGEQNRWSPDLEAMYGLAPGAYDGVFETWKKLVHPEDWPAVKEAIGRANESGEVDAEYRVVHPDGVVRWLQAKGRILSDSRGQPERVVGFMLDVTERRQAAEELRRLEHQLRRAQRLESMGTLAGGIAHDFNNILGAILGYGEMALRDAPRGGRLRRDLESITTAGERGRALVDRILAFSRSGIGERVAVHVEKVVRESLDLLMANLPAGITVKAELRAGRAAMRGDPTQVHQVVMNLATNGIQAMDPGGILRVSLGAARLDAQRIATTGTLAPGNYILLKVADTGRGIPAGILDRIFDPFFTTKEVGVGTGLGLSLVHGIVTEVGGAIDVETTLGAGSVFTVYLPHAGDVADGVADEQPAMPRGDQQRVLVVDDEEPLVRLATETLEELGYRPVGFTSSAAALDAFRADPKRFDAVITDERMPGMSGSALIREVRGIRRSIPILLVSGYVGGLVTNRAYNAGADEVLKKPLSARELATSLARVLHLQ